MPPYIAQKFDVIEVGKPVFIVRGECMDTIEAYKAVELFDDALRICIYLLIGDEFSHLCLPRGVSDSPRTASKKRNTSVPCIPQVSQGKKGTMCPIWSEGPVGSTPI